VEDEIDEVVGVCTGEGGSQGVGGCIGVGGSEGVGGSIGVGGSERVEGEGDTGDIIWQRSTGLAGVTRPSMEDGLDMRWMMSKELPISELCSVDCVGVCGTTSTNGSFVGDCTGKGGPKSGISSSCEMKAKGSI